MGRRAVGSQGVRGPLAPYAAGFASWLESQRYAQRTVGERLWQLRHLSLWLEGEGLSAGELTPDQLERFARTRRAAGSVTLVSPRSGLLLLRYLQQVGVAAVPRSAAVEGPLEELLEGYRRYLVVERGVMQQTVARYEPDARLFLSQQQERDGLGVERLSAADVSGFLARECPRRSVAGARQLVLVVRSLLGYLHVAGVISTPLRWAVPGVADLRDRSLARGVEPGAVARLVAGCDRRRTVGRRDYAILLLLVRLGLRGGEVAAMQLDDLDWRGGELLVRGKGGRRDRLPLPVDVGEALVSYLRRRPRADSRALFLRVRAPAVALSTSGIRSVVRHACVRAGLPPVGPHRLRHTAATGMLRAGASLSEVAQVLRHQAVETTAIYAKVDHTALRSLAQPWPGGAA